MQDTSSITQNLAENNYILTILFITYINRCKCRIGREPWYSVVVIVEMLVDRSCKECGCPDIEATGNSSEQDLLKKKKILDKCCE